MNKKKIIIAVVAVIVVIAIAVSIFLANKDTKTICTISFDTNGGKEVVASQEIEDGKNVTKPANPTKEGYEFLGWYLNGEYFDFKTPVEENITLEAKWKEIIVDEEQDINDEENKEDEEKITKYTVKFDSNGGSKVASKTVEENKKVTKPADPKKDGYVFKGWYLGNSKYNFSNKVTKNITLTAKWDKVKEEKPVEPSEPETPVTPEAKEYTVKFDVDGKLTTKTVKEGEKVAQPSKPTKDGYTFLGWYLNGERFDFATGITADITLKAEWKKNDVITTEVVTVSSIGTMEQVKIYVKLNGNRVAGTVDITYINGVTETKNIPADGYLEVKSAYTKISNPKVK